MPTYSCLPLLLVAALASSPAQAGTLPPGLLDPPVGDELLVRSGTPFHIELAGGVPVDGAFLDLVEDNIHIATPEGVREIPLVLVQDMQVLGRSITVDELRSALDRWRVSNLAADTYGPPPVLAGAASFVWPGTGQLLMGHVGAFVGYTAVEAVFVASGVYMATHDQLGQLIPLGALDLVIRAWACGDAFREARQRRQLRRDKSRLGEEEDDGL